MVVIKVCGVKNYLTKKKVNKGLFRLLYNWGERFIKSCFLLVLYLLHERILQNTDGVVVFLGIAKYEHGLKVFLYIRIE